MSKLAKGATARPHGLEDTCLSRAAMYLYLISASTPAIVHRCVTATAASMQARRRNNNTAFHRVDDSPSTAICRPCCRRPFLRGRASYSSRYRRFVASSSPTSTRPPLHEAPALSLNQRQSGIGTQPDSSREELSVPLRRFQHRDGPSSSLHQSCHSLGIRAHISSPENRLPPAPFAQLSSSGLPNLR